MKKYIINENRLKQLLISEIELEALQQAGVDNWGSYGIHWDYYFDLEDKNVGVDDIDELIQKEVNSMLSNFQLLIRESFDIMTLFKKKEIKLSPNLETTTETVWKDKNYIYTLEADGSFNKYEWRGFVETLTPTQMQKVMTEYYNKFGDKNEQLWINS